jgi:hypothetical protein
LMNPLKLPLTDPKSGVQSLLVIKMIVGENEAVKALDGAERPFYRQFPRCAISKMRHTYVSQAVFGLPASTVGSGEVLKDQSIVTLVPMAAETEAMK